ncbi:unnamed protein product [Closterium sp. NIES-65]|nr:unnamed protein product [Closterium sp. NIES-65]
MALKWATPSWHLTNPQQATASGPQQEWRGCEPQQHRQELGLRGLEGVVAKVVASDGHNWLKYGQKRLNQSSATRCYYKCSLAKAIPRCPAKKTVDINSPDSIHVTYKCRLHNHPGAPTRRTPYYPSAPVANLPGDHHINLPASHGAVGSAAAPEAIQLAASCGDLEALVQAVQHGSVGVTCDGCAAVANGCAPVADGAAASHARGSFTHWAAPTDGCAPAADGCAASHASGSLKQRDIPMKLVVGAAGADGAPLADGRAAVADGFAAAHAPGILDQWDALQTVFGASNRASWVQKEEKTEEVYAMGAAWGEPTLSAYNSICACATTSAHDCTCAHREREAPAEPRALRNHVQTTIVEPPALVLQPTIIEPPPTLVEPPTINEPPTIIEPPTSIVRSAAEPCEVEDPTTSTTPITPRASSTNSDRPPSTFCTHRNKACSTAKQVVAASLIPAEVFSFLGGTSTIRVSDFAPASMRKDLQSWLDDAVQEDRLFEIESLPHANPYSYTCAYPNSIHITTPVYVPIPTRIPHP